jgi:hypothetical protein
MEHKSDPQRAFLRAVTSQIAIIQVAFDAIAATLPLGRVGYEAERTEKGEVHIWLEERWLNKLRSLRVDQARAVAT